MSEENDEAVTRLPVRFKHPAPPDRTLVFPHDIGQVSKCDHSFGCTYIVDEAKAEVECRQCGEKLNPIWVLRQLCSWDSRFHESARRYQDEMARLADRSRTKCDNCGEMTRISRR